MAWSAGVVVLLILLAGGVIYVFVTSDYVRAQVENHASAALSGRKTKIGNISVDWGWTSHFRLDDVQVSNTDWGKADHMFKAERIEADIRLWPLIRGDIVLPRLTLRKPDLALEINDQGESNWSFKQSPVANTTVQVAKPEERHETPLVNQLEIVNGHVSYNDIKRKLDLDGTVQTATGEAGAESQAELSLKGKLEGQPLSLKFVGGSAIMLRDTSKPYPVDLDIAYGDTKLKVKGTIQDPFKFTDPHLQLSLTGPDLADIYPLLGIPGPPTPPYEIAGQLARDGDQWRVEDMKLHAGDSDLSGDVAIDQSRKPNRLTAHLVSQRLVFADLAPLIGASPGKEGSSEKKQTEEQPQAKSTLFPNIPLHVERLRAMDMDVTFDARKVLAPPYIPIKALAAHIQINDGQALVEPLDMVFGGGKLIGELAVDARTDTPKLRTNLKFENVELAQFFRGSRFFDTTKAKLNGRITLAGNGRSLAKVMGTADGDIVIAMNNGWISGLMVSLAGLQLGDALILYVTGDNTIPIHCALAHLNFSHGTMAFDRTLLDTEKSVLHVKGRVDLGNQEVDVQVSADAKEFDLLDLHAPVLVQGELRKPGISIDRAIPIPTPELGGAQGVACEQLTQQLFANKPSTD
jgi:uncharacterized protein involved in outer membrane biogenesis